MIKITPKQKEIVGMLEKDKDLKIIYIALPIKKSGYAIVNKKHEILYMFKYRTFKSLLSKKLIKGQESNKYFILNN